MTRARRWRFANDVGADRMRRVIEVEVEPADGINLTTGDRWEGIHVKARYPLLRDRRWKRANVVGPLAPDTQNAAQEIARRLLAE